MMSSIISFSPPNEIGITIVSVLQDKDLEAQIGKNLPNELVSGTTQVQSQFCLTL